MMNWVPAIRSKRENRDWSTRYSVNSRSSYLFCFDGNRQGYLERVLDPVHLGVNIANDVWTDYVGDSPMVDYRYEWGGQQFDTVNLGAYLSGISQTDLTTDTTHYRHTDHLGSTWYPSGDDLTTMYRRAGRTAFGQHVVGTGSGRIRGDAILLR
jgi:hypothetical protein